VTFVIDSKGVVCDVLSSVLNFNEHVSFVRKALEEIEAAEKKGQETTPQDETPTEPAAA
jgi:thioredoxin-dependent peroxiredoxin